METSFEMTVGGLFAGIGGFELAAQWAGLTPVWSNEIDPFCCQVLRKNFKHRIIEDDIRNIGKHNLEPVDILTGGFPCQPFSVAGKRKGKNDDRFLWPEMFRISGEIKPRWIVGENVAGIIGLALNTVLSNLEDQGYNTETYFIPACGKDAPHERERVWIVAHAGGQRIQVNKAGTIQNFNWHNQGKIHGREKQPCRTLSTGVIESTTDANEQGLSIGLQTRFIGLPRSTGKLARGQSSRTHSADNWSKFPTQSPICRGDDGLPNRVDRIKSLGNAIVPQVALEIFKAIKEVESLNQL